MRVRIYFDDELDKDIIAQMPHRAKGAWVRERLKQSLNNESLLNEQKIISVLEKYLAQNNVSMSLLENNRVQDNGLPLANSSSRSNEEKTSEATPNSFQNQKSQKDTPATWRMPE